MELITDNVNKIIHGKSILSDVNIQLSSGNIYGFIGHNGSGKTMLFRTLSGLISTTSGTIIWNGKILHKDFSILPNLGIVLENVGLYPHLTGVQNLLYLASLTERADLVDIKIALQRVGLDPEDKRTYQKYSLGMKQRLAIAQAVMEHPDIIMLDEPTNGLDQDGVSIIRKLILEEKKRGALVLLASHNRDDIHILTDHLYQINQGIVTKYEERIQ